MLNINESAMQTVAQEAFDKAQGDGRWQRAIAKAVQQIRENPYIHFDGDAALILSDSNEIYTANGTCQCKAFANRKPCWHRAMARLLKRYEERAH
jgi:formaldehyde-activating enzyme involved in methanogenesis